MAGLDIQEQLPEFPSGTEMEDCREYPTAHPLDGAEEGLIALIGAIFTQLDDRNHEEPLQCDGSDAVD